GGSQVRFRSGHQEVGSFAKQGPEIEHLWSLSSPRRWSRSAAKGSASCAIDTPPGSRRIARTFADSRESTRRHEVTVRLCARASRLSCVFAVRVKTRWLVPSGTSHCQWRRCTPRRSNPREQRSV